MSVRAILVADDERHLRQALFTALTRLGHAVELAENGREALDKIQGRRFDLVICDLGMPGLDGLGVLKAVQQRDPGLPVILMTAHGSVEAAVEAMREGARDFILKPFPAGLIEEAVNRALAGAAGTPAAAPKEDRGESARPLLTRNQRMTRLLELARTVAASPATVLLQGESGTGKELLARFIHQHSPRVDGPFVAVNCASLPENLLESELFGHEKGAFTGAVAKKQGKF
jgi:two-component system response regulator FlrC